MDPLIVISNDQPAPGFTLADLDRTTHCLEEWRGKVVVLNFWSAECPWSARANHELVADLKNWGEIVFLATIAANANEPVELVRQAVSERGLPLVLLDPQQKVVNLYGAVTTPHLFVIDSTGILRYQGALDDVTFRQRTPTRFYLRQAVEAVLAGRTPDPAQTPTYGCTIVRI